MAIFLSLWSGLAGLCGKQSRVHLFSPAFAGTKILAEKPDFG
jgi:hypothetical protein